MNLIKDVQTSVTVPSVEDETEDVQWEDKFFGELSKTKFATVANPREKFYKALSGEKHKAKHALLNLCLRQVLPVWDERGIIEEALSGIQCWWREKNIKYNIWTDFNGSGGAIATLQLSLSNVIPKIDYRKWENIFFDDLGKTKFHFLTNPRNRFYKTVGGEKNKAKWTLLDLCLRQVLPNWKNKRNLQEGLNGLQYTWEKEGIEFSVWKDFKGSQGVMPVLKNTQDDAVATNKMGKDSTVFTVFNSHENSPKSNDYNWENRFFQDLSKTEFSHVTSSQTKFYDTVCGKKDEDKWKLINSCLTAVLLKWKRMGVIEQGIDGVQSIWDKKGIAYNIRSDFNEPGGAMYFVTPPKSDRKNNEKIIGKHLTDKTNKVRKTHDSVNNINPQTPSDQTSKKNRQELGNAPMLEKTKKQNTDNHVLSKKNLKKYVASYSRISSLRSTRKLSSSNTKEQFNTDAVSDLNHDHEQRLHLSSLLDSLPLAFLHSQGIETPKEVLSTSSKTLSVFYEHWLSEEKITLPTSPYDQICEWKKKLSLMVGEKSTEGERNGLRERENNKGTVESVDSASFSEHRETTNKLLDKSKKCNVETTTDKNMTPLKTSSPKKQMLDDTKKDKTQNRSNKKDADPGKRKVQALNSTKKINEIVHVVPESTSEIIENTDKMKDFPEKKNMESTQNKDELPIGLPQCRKQTSDRTKEKKITTHALQELNKKSTKGNFNKNMKTTKKKRMALYELYHPPKKQKLDDTNKNGNIVINKKSERNDNANEIIDSYTEKGPNSTSINKAQLKSSLHEKNSAPDQPTESFLTDSSSKHHKRKRSTKKKDDGSKRKTKKAPKDSKQSYNSQMEVKQRSGKKQSTTTKSGSKKLNDETQDQDKYLYVMNTVSSLSRSDVRDVDAEQIMPRQFITVFNSITEQLYGFKIDIRRSNIPGCTNGAFLKYLGAKVLKDQIRQDLDLVMSSDHVVVNDSDTIMPPLTATMADGTGVTVTLTGDKLSNKNENNSMFCPIAAKSPLNAVIPIRSNVTVTIKGKNLDQSLTNKSTTTTTAAATTTTTTTAPPLCALVVSKKKGNAVNVKITGHTFDREREFLKERIQQCSGTNDDTAKEGKGIGFLGLLNKTDYNWSDDPFNTHFAGCGLIDLGRYGPFRRTDRKSEPDFLVKDFVFRHLPWKWSCGVGESLKGFRQMIDLCDDDTGNLSVVAKKNIPTYINEIGTNNSSNKSNVLVLEKDHRSVHYFLNLGKEIVMKQGDVVELTVDHRNGHEPQSERNRRSNMMRKSKQFDANNDDTDSPTNFEGRRNIINVIDSMSETDIISTLKFIQTRILNPIIDSINSHLLSAMTCTSKSWKDNNDGQNDSFICFSRQLVARRRLFWLSKVFKKRIGAKFTSRRLHAKIDDNVQDLSFSIETLDLMEWTSMHDDLTRLKPIITHANGENEQSIHENFLNEIYDEHLYKCSSVLPKPLDESLWCPIARRLLSDILLLISRLMLPLGTKKEKEDVMAEKKNLSTRILSLAQYATENIKKQCHMLNDAESFQRQNYSDLLLEEISFQSPSKENDAEYVEFVEMFKHHSDDDIHRKSSDYKVSKNVRAAILELQAYRDMITIGGLNCDFASDDVKNFEQSGVTVMTKCSQSTDGIPRYTSTIKKGIGQIDENWYILWQIIPVVHSVASTCINWKDLGQEQDKNNEYYSFEKLCKAVGVNEQDAGNVITKITEQVSPQRPSRLVLKKLETLSGRKKISRVLPNKSRFDRKMKFYYKNKGKLSKKSPKKVGKNIKNITALKNKKLKSKKSKKLTPQKRPFNVGMTSDKDIFFGVVWKKLEEIGWVLEVGNRPNDRYFLPPGIQRGKGFKNRVDFFDSILLLMNTLHNDSRWNAQAEIVDILKTYNSCTKLRKILMKRKDRHGKITVESLLEEVTSKGKKKPDSEDHEGLLKTFKESCSKDDKIQLKTSNVTASNDRESPSKTSNINNSGGQKSPSNQEDIRVPTVSPIQTFCLV